MYLYKQAPLENHNLIRVPKTELFKYDSYTDQNRILS